VFTLNRQETLPPTESKKPGFFYGYIIVLAGFVILGASAGGFYTFGVFLKPVSAEFGWTRAVTSGAYSLSFLLCGVGGAVMGGLNDRFGPRMLMTASGFFLGLGFLLMSQLTAIWQLYLYYGVMVAIGISTLPPIMSTVARWFVKRRGLMTGIAYSGVGTGTIIMPPMARWLISTYDWRTSYIIMGIIILVFIILAAQFLKRDPAKIGQVPYGESEVKQRSLVAESEGLTSQQAIHTKQFWILCAIYCCYGFFVQATFVHIVPHATDIGISAISAASILSIIGGLSIFGRIGAGSASDRIGSKRALIIVFSLMLAALFWLQLAKELWGLYLFAVVFGFSYGGMAVQQSPITAESFGLRAHGAILGMILFSVTVGGAIGPLLAGRIFDVTSSYQQAFLICGVVGIAGLILTSLLKPIRREG